ncbi:hypothetical protein [Nitriliruptor alkaliphilus]|uniref:hypothetical protein n=1 Tax=Nitriliruptor alkaliphilus TaxID=427918 RepID=UPI0006979312|nr:hypothetical protein [Nitriliruptor alkaliphilus]
MSTSTRLHAPERAPDSPVAAGPPESPEPRPDGTGGRRRPNRAIVAALVALLVLTGAAAVQQLRSASADAAAAEERTARAELARDVQTVRESIADPAREGQTAATGLLRHQLVLIAGEAPDPSVGDRLVDQLTAAADRLDDAADTPAPERSDLLSAAIVGPVFDQLDGLDAQAADVADTFRAAAEHARGWLAAVRDLDEAAVRYADSTDELQGGSDPDALAAAWRAERDRIAAYAGAVDEAGEHEASAPLADAHRLLVDGLGDLADEAVARLEAGDVDGYNQLLADRLGGDDRFGFAEALDAARDQVADASLAGPLEDARARGLGLLTSLEELRRATPAQLAAVA